MPIALVMPAVWKMALYGVVAIGGIVASWYINKLITKGGNEIKDTTNANKATEGRTDVQAQTQAMDQQSDDLKKIEGR